MESPPLIDRVLDLLGLLSGHPGGMSLTEICRQQSIPKAAAYRALSALVRNGFVEQDAASEWYRLTLKTTTIGLRYLAELGITEICQPVLDRLAAKTEELVRLVVASGDTLLWVAKSQGALSGLRYDPDMGQAVVLHATAAGRTWLSTLDEDEAVQIVLERGFSVPARFYRRLITNEAALRAELRATRERGYGLAIEEGAAGTAAIAVPILNGPDERQRAVGAVSVAGPVVRMTRARIAEIIPDVRNAAVELSQIWPVRRYLDAASIRHVGNR
jgi:IclR family transcriptional regulator, acetate operon repressor